MEGFKLYIRVILFGLLTVVLLLVMTGQLYYIQIVKGDQHAQENERTIKRSITIPASRGEILDRYGRPLITNKLSYTLTIDLKRLEAQKDPNAVVLQLVQLSESLGSPYTDALPVTNPPFRFEDMSDTQKSRLTKYLKKLEWDDYETLGADGFIAKLCERFGIDPDTPPYEMRRIAGIRYELDLRIEVPTVAPYVFASDVDMGLITRIKELDLPSVEVNCVPIREVHTDYAAHLLGRVGQIQEKDSEYYKEKGYAANEIVGVDGAEKAFEDWLHGTAGTQVEETNMSGKVQNILSAKKTDPGKNVMLTIDIVFQELVERILEDGILDMRENYPALKGKEAEGGAAVVIDVRSGEVLASATYPAYSLSEFQQEFAIMNEDPMKPLINRAVSGTYEPGSTFKMVTAAAAMREGVITTKSRIYDRVVYTFYPSYTPRCTGSHGSINVSDALKVSCNYFFFESGRLTTIEKIGAMAAQFGLGQPSGIELDFAENTGSVAGPATSDKLGITWFPGDTLQASIGQGANLYTPLQLANYAATIANGGTHYSAHMLKTVKSYDYNETYYEAPAKVLNTIDITAEQMKAIQQGMRAVAQSGTAAGTFARYPIAVAAKTGSVQATGVPNNAVFVTYAPYDDPQIAIAVVVEKGGGGSRVAPIAREIYDAWFRINTGLNDLPEENRLLS